MRTLFITLFLVGILTLQGISQTPICIGHQVKFQSQELEQERFVNIYLPTSYHKDSSQTYPVIYLLDGSLDEDFIHIAGLTQFHSYPWLEHMPECIVVGIENINRYHDFTYPSDKHEDLKINIDNGGSPEFIAFIENELQPYIDQHYNCDSINTIIGQSLGGLLATEILFTKPDLFDNYLIVSPSLWWDDRSLLDYKLTDYTKSKNIFIAVGQEGKLMKKVAKKLFKKLKKKSDPKLRLNFQFYKKLDHGDALHLAAYDGLDWLFE